MFASPIARLVQQLAKLPGIGEKTAARLAFHILRASPEDAAALARRHRRGPPEDPLLLDLLRPRPRPTPARSVAIQRRDGGLVCVVAQPQDLIAIERAGGYRGRYHVLHGLLSPLDGIGPDDLRVTELLRRCGDGDVQEVILATSPSVEGEATAVYLAKLLRPLGVRTTRIATGVPMGGELEYADQATLARAIDGRREM